MSEKAMAAERAERIRQGRGAAVTGPDVPSRPLSGKRWLLLFVYLLLSWPLFLTDSQATAAASVVTGVLVALVLLMIVAAVQRAWRWWRWRRAGQTAQQPRFRHSVVSVPVVLVAFAMALLAATGRNLNTVQQRQSLAASDAVSSNPLDRDRSALAAWMSSLPADQDVQAHTTHNLRLAAAAINATPANLTGALNNEQAAHQWALRFAAAVAREPAATADVRALATLRHQEAGFLLTATTDYITGLKRRELKTLKAGDAMLERADATVRREAQQGEALYHRLGGPSAFAGRVDFGAFAAEMRQAQKDAGR